MRLTNFATKLSAAAAMVFAGMAARAQDVTEGLEIVGAPVDGALGFQPASTELARDLQWLDGMLLVIITAITLFVVALLAYVIVRYNRRANPNAATFTHNSPLEVAWTVLPIVILVVIGSFSLPILFKQQEFPEGDITIKVTGYQWYWSYEYVDDGVLFDSYMLGHPATMPASIEAEPFVRSEGMNELLASYGYSEDEFLLATDTAVVVPVGATVVMQVTAADVIHSWTIPAFGVKQDAVPGRLAQLWFAAEREGIYFGQCSELCGKDHAYMPITVKVVSQEAYDAWLETAKEEFPA
ncbi:cytochrome c oxidase subunit II [Marivivens niveibacter]|uniref:Cytochrome c oxidase subunit 2 n=1 Tax=Marivivens niveibacter TaxID=1930667 RepID=A0A251WXW7_9RHOB|nr:cytochrome c oxidase subunit II [Marivivens niveibacter]OUD08894.1 cytochrome c oxidase subunit II [Marivivens niveibacter]